MSLRTCPHGLPTPISCLPWRTPAEQLEESQGCPPLVSISIPGETLIRYGIWSKVRPPSLALGFDDHGPGIAPDTLISNTKRGWE